MNGASVETDGVWCELDGSAGEPDGSAVQLAGALRRPAARSHQRDGCSVELASGIIAEIEKEAAPGRL